MASTYTKVVFNTQQPDQPTATKLNKLIADLSEAIASAGGGGGTSGVFIWGETPAGLVNGTNKSYTTANPYVAGQLAVYLNGVRQRRSNDYSETGATTFQFNSAPLSGDLLSVDYLKA
jgi:hypothetical protein